MMSDHELTELLCQALGSIPGWQYPAVKTSPVGVFYGAIGTAPDQAVGVRVYGVADTRVSGVRGRRVQLRLRGRKGVRRGADELELPATAVLEGLSRVGGISGITHLSMAPMGADNDAREERTDNYIITFDNDTI
ncbi:minor capsid protein [Microbacterium sp. LjRoot45]|uniref:phage tail terminator protein n=1 Tax=Microbacterium sp. LjRoot45 TaxID=3342329 RepID=UPI003ECD5B36